MKQLKSEKKKQNRILLAPVVAYMMAGYGLLFTVYRVELLADKFCNYCRVFRPLTFSVTAWHEGQMWISLLFPITWPVLGLRALLLLVLGTTCACLEIIFAYLGKVYSWVWRQLAWLRSTIGRIIFEILAGLRHLGRAAVMKLRSWFQLAMRFVYSGFRAVRDEVVAAIRFSVRAIIPVAIRFWSAATWPFRWLWFALRRAAGQVALWIRLSLSKLWRGMVVAGTWLASSLRFLGRQLAVALRSAGHWIASSLRLLGAWLLIPVRWFWAGILDIRTLVVQATVTISQWISMSLRTLGAWLMIPLRWFWAGLLDIRTLVVQAAVTISQWISLSLRTLGAWLLIPLHWVWAQSIFTWRGVRTVATALFEAFWTAVDWSTGTLEQIWRQLATFTQIVWSSLVNLIHTLWSWIMAPLRQVWAALRLAWNTVARLISAISGWLTAKARLLWHGLAVIWLALTGNIRAAWAWLVNTLHLGWEWVAVTAQTLWKPIHNAGVAIMALLRSAMKQARLLLGKIWSAIGDLGRQVGKMLAQARTTIILRLKTLFRSTGFWKRVFADLRGRRAELMASLAKLRAGLTAPLHGLKDQAATLTSGLRDQIQSIGTDLRHFMAELREQVRTSAGQSRKRASEIREETVETLRNIVPGGRV